MGLIEKEKRRKSAEEAERKARWERERPIREAEARRNAEAEAVILKEEAGRPLREQALEKSIVPQLAKEAAPLIGGHFLWGHNGNIHIFIDSKSKYEPLGGKEHNGRVTTTETFIDIQARKDGSINIGGRILSSFEARDFKKVDDALERAARHPSRNTTVKDDGAYSSSIPPGGIGGT